MRRSLTLTLLLAAPLLASAQTAGQITFSPDASINRSECSSTTSTVNLSWNVQVDSGYTFATGGVFRVYAANQDRSSNPWCYTEAESGTGTVVAKRLIATDITASSALESTLHAVKTADLASVTAGSSCTSGTYTAYVCVQWIDSTSVVRGYAKGTVSITLDGPNAPTVTAVSPGEEALNVTIEAASSGTAAEDFQARAIAMDLAQDGATHLSDWDAGGSVRISGLVNGVPYNVSARARSSDGNESAWSDPPYAPADLAEVTPIPILDAREAYDHFGGRDSGGCQAGGAGLAALLGAAALLRLRRRS
jgi:hypothetical protein